MAIINPTKQEFQGTLIKELNEIFQDIYRHWCENEEKQDWQISIKLKISRSEVENIIWNIKTFWRNTRILAVLEHDSETRRDFISSNKGKVYLNLDMIRGQGKMTFTLKKIKRKSIRGN